MKTIYPVVVSALLICTQTAIAAAAAPSEFCVSSLPGNAAGGPSVSRSGLAWESQKMEVQATLGQTIVRTSYHFTNTSKVPVSIVDIAPSCGCVSTEIAKLDFAPAESGEIKVTLDLAMDDAVGPQERFILVTTNDAPKTPFMLRLAVQVPTPFEASAKVVSWKLGDKHTTKEVAIQPGPGIDDLKLIPASQNDDFSVALKSDAAGHGYLVSITPTNTATPCYAQIRLNAESSAFHQPIPCKINVQIE